MNKWASDIETASGATIWVKHRGRRVRGLRPAHGRKPCWGRCGSNWCAVNSEYEQTVCQWLRLRQYKLSLFTSWDNMSTFGRNVLPFGYGYASRTWRNATWRWLEVGVIIIIHGTQHCQPVRFATGCEKSRERPIQLSRIDSFWK